MGIVMQWITIVQLISYQICLKFWKTYAYANVNIFWGPISKNQCEFKKVIVPSTASYGRRIEKMCLQQKGFWCITNWSSKGFDCISCELLIAKLNAYGFDLKSLRLVNDYLNRKQRVKIHTPFFRGWSDIWFFFCLIYIHTCDLFFQTNDSDTAKYADGNTNYVCCESTDEVIHNFQDISEILFRWFERNEIKCHCTKIKFSIKDLFSKCDQIRSFLRIWSHLLKKSLIENFIFCAVSNPDKCHLLMSLNDVDTKTIDFEEISNSGSEILSSITFDRGFKFEKKWTMHKSLSFYEFS